MQANKFKIPRLGFINKLDRQGASVALTIESIKRRLKVEPLLINIPDLDALALKSGSGLIDLATMLYYEYLDESGKKVNIETIDKDHKMYNKAIHYRGLLIE
jgi:elongation factor G